MSRKSQYDYNTFTQSFTIPCNADPIALEQVKQYIDVATDPAVRIMLKRDGDDVFSEMPRDPDIFSRLNSSKLRRALHAFNAEAGPVPQGTIYLLYPERKKAGSTPKSSGGVNNTKSSK